MHSVRLRHVPLILIVASVARRYNRQPGERSQAWRRTVDNTGLRRLTQAGRCQQTCTCAYLGGGVGRCGGARSPRTTGVCEASGRNVSVVQRQRTVTTAGDDGGRRRRRATTAGDDGGRRRRATTAGDDGGRRRRATAGDSVRG